MVWVLSRWGYYVSFRAPTVLSITSSVDEYVLASSGREASEAIRDLTLRRMKSQLAEAVLNNLIVKTSWSTDPARLLHTARADVSFYSVL